MRWHFHNSRLIKPATGLDLHQEWCNGKLHRIGSPITYKWELKTCDCEEQSNV